MKRALLIGLAACALGCSGGGSAPANSTSGTAAQPPLQAEKPVDPEHKLYEQVRSGAVQLGGATDDVEDALRACEELLKTSTKEQKDALEDVKALIDSAGAGIADYTADVPEFEEFKKQLPQFDDQRLKAIQESNDSLHDLREARGMLDSLEANAPQESVSKFEDLASLVDVAIGDLSDAITSMGGVIEKEN